jgi:PAS domain S-box-containing protein
MDERQRAPVLSQIGGDAFSALFLQNPLPMWIYDVQTLAFLDVNAAAVERYGYSRAEFLGMKISDIRPVEDVSRLLGDVKRDRPALESSRGWRHVTKSGELRDVEITSHTLEFAGRPAILVVVHDVTESRQLEEQLRRFARAVEQSPTAVIVTDTDEKVVYVNPRFVQLTGYTADELVGTPAPVLTNLPADEHHRVLETLRGGGTWTGELQARTKDDHVYWELATISVVKDANGNVTRFVKVSEDITERKESQAQIARQMMSMARRATEFEALLDVARDLAGQRNLNALLRMVVERATALLGASGGFIYLYDPARHDLEVVVAENVPIQLGTRLSLGEGLAGVVAQSRQPKVVDRYQEWEHRAARFSGIPVTSVVEVPMQYSGELVGVLGVAELDGTTRTFSDDDVRVLALLASHAAGAVSETRLHEQTQRRLRRLGALRTIDMAITASLDLRVTLSVFLDQATGHLGVDAASILLLNPRTQTLEHAVGRGFRTDGVARTRLRLGQGYAGRAALERRTVTVPHLAPADPGRPHLEGEGIQAYYATPLVAKGEIRGVLEVFHRSELQADAEWAEFLEALAGQAAIAVDSAMLFNDLKRSNVDLSLAYDTTLEGWSRALDLRDKETEGHTLRVTEVAVVLALALGVSEEEIVHIRRGALLHDIGKMGIPDAILNKPGPLTDDEWVVMRRHPDLARDLLSAIAYLKPALDIPYCHHEKYDGTGYPRGLKGDQIPLAARIFAVVDVWDALRSDRPYRASLPEDQVLDYLRQGAGTHFDPQVVDVFVHLDLTALASGPRA